MTSQWQDDDTPCPVTRRRSLPAAMSPPLAPPPRSAMTPAPRKRRIDQTPPRRSNAHEPSQRTEEAAGASVEEATSVGETEKKRVLVERDAPVPTGKRLKRTIRVEKRQVPVPEETLHAHAVAVARIESRNLFRTIDASVPRVTGLRRIVESTLRSEYGRSFGDNGAALARAIAYLDGPGAALATPTRANPANKQLMSRLTTLRAVVARRMAEEAEWSQVRSALREVRRVVVPTAPAVDERVRGDTEMETRAREVVEDFVLQANRLDESLRSTKVEEANGRGRVRVMVDEFNAYLGSGTLAKTPRKPAQFPRGGEIGESYAR